MSVKLEQDELEKIRKFSEKYYSVTQLYGELYYQKLLLEKDIAELDNERARLTAELAAKYGTGRVDLTTGTFNPES